MTDKTIKYIDKRVARAVRREQKRMERYRRQIREYYNRYTDIRYAYMEYERQMCDLHGWESITPTKLKYYLGLSKMLDFRYMKLCHAAFPPNEWERLTIPRQIMFNLLNEYENGKSEAAGK